MDYLQLQHRQNELRKEFKNLYKSTHGHNLSKLELIKGKIDELFECRIVWDHEEDETKTELEAVFYIKTDKGLFEIIMPYSIENKKFDFEYKDMWCQDIYGNTYSFENKNLKLAPSNFNPKKPSVKEYINWYLNID